MRTSPSIQRCEREHTFTLKLPQLGEFVWHAFADDPSIDKTSDEHYREIEVQIARYLTPCDWTKLRVLEVGAYRHFSGHLLATKKGMEAVVTDISPASLRDGVSRAKRLGIGDFATPVVADFHDFPFSDRYFDAVFVASSIHHTWHPEVVLDEMFRVLRPGGLLILYNEPCERTCCFYAFRSNRQDGFTPLERFLHESQLLRTISSPFWGSRPEELFGMVENDRIPLSLYFRTFALHGSLQHRVLTSANLMGPLESSLLAIREGGVPMRERVYRLLADAVESAARHYGRTESLLGYRLPTQCDVHRVAGEVALSLVALARRDVDEEEVNAYLFGAALEAVVRKKPDSSIAPATSLFRRAVDDYGDGVYHEQRETDSIAALLGAPVIPDIHIPGNWPELVRWFPGESWQVIDEAQGICSLANLQARAEIRIGKLARPTILLLRFYAAVTNGVPYHVRIWAGELLIDDQLIVLQESRLTRALLPAETTRIVVEVTDMSGRTLDQAWNLRLGACQLIAVHKDLVSRGPLEETDIANHTALSIESSFLTGASTVRDAVRKGQTGDGAGVGCDDQDNRAAEPGFWTSKRRLRMLNPDVEERADVYREEFSRALPFRHVCIDHFFEASVADRLVEDFPDFFSQKAINEVGEVGQKAVFEALSDISPFYAEVAHYLASEDFPAFVTRVTGIEGLLWAGESMYGGGTHENLDGIDLDPHVDFNYDDRTGLHRRLDILVYLNPEWDEAWGGSLELHSNPRDPANNYVRTFCPAFNRCVIFETNEHSWHGFPRIVLPPDKKHLSRKSLAIYLYTKDRPAEEIVGEHATFYVQRPIPATVRPGEVLSPDDYNVIQHLVQKRDVFIKVYQDLQVRDGEQKAAFKWKVAQLQDELKVAQEQNRLQIAKLHEQLARERAARAVSVAEPTAGQMFAALGHLAGARARALLSRIPGARTVVRRSRFLAHRLRGR